MPTPTPTPEPANIATDSDALHHVFTAVKAIFSWIILMPIAVIVSGKLLAYRFKLGGASKQLFRIPIVGLFHIQADNDEVVLGFSGFLLTLFFSGGLAGHAIHRFFQYQFGIDPGQFNTLCVFSSFATVVWAFFLYLLTSSRTGPLGDVVEEHTRLLDKVSKKTEEPE